MDELVTVAVPPVVLSPPPLELAWFLLTVLESTESVPRLAMPPPTAAELPLTLVPAGWRCCCRN